MKYQMKELKIIEIKDNQEIHQHAERMTRIRL